ncbi:MAG TPA: DUF3472 domain-containing protein, partial [Terracidiphilus sp.]|nr:DUF3472 domain-containing protein [Terracidiphilus sp.]
MGIIPQALRAGGPAVLLLAFWAPVPAAEAPSATSAPTAPRAARSVHLHYPAPDGTLYYNEVTVEQSQRGTYFCVCGFSRGYFGIQELGDGRKVVLFSVWDPAGPGGEKQDPNAVEADRRVEVLTKGDGTRVRRFGGEGTGAQCFLDFPWETGRACKFLVQATTEKDKTIYSAWFCGQGEDKPAPSDTDRSWKHMATFRTGSRGEPLRG